MKKSHIVIIILAGILAYLNSFDVPFHFDDSYTIEQNLKIRRLSNIPSFFTDIKGPIASRPLTLATLALNYSIGGLDVSGYHAINLLLHILNGVLLYALILISIDLPGRDVSDIRPVALVASLMFMVHPVQTEAVTYIISRSMLLATSFYLGGLMLFAKAARAKTKRPLYVAALFIASLMGMASREDFVTFPLMLILYDLVFVSKLSPRGITGNIRIHVPVLSTLLYLAYLVFSFDYPASAGVSMNVHTPSEYLMTQLSVQMHYIRLLLLPANQNIAYYFPMTRSLLDPQFIVSLMAYLCIWVLGLLALRSRPALSFCIIWFMVTITPSSSIIPLADPMFEHRLYLPSVGFFTLVSSGLWKARSILSTSPR